MNSEYYDGELIAARSAIFDTAVDILYIFDMETLKILDMNPHGLRALGYSIREIQQKDFYDLHAIEERDRAIEIVSQYRQQGYISGVRDLHLRRKDGSLIPVEKNGRISIIGARAFGH